VHIHPAEPEPVVSDKDSLPKYQDLEIELVPQALRIIVGKGIGLSFPVDAAPSVPPLSGPQELNAEAQHNEPDAQHAPNDAKETVAA
jgi:hypothetical protein